ncbi:phage tail tape measure protein [Mycobacteroides abscessus subsp. abscessus]|uniref:phage tail tape measure protein n=1 Tax=Mycobacteroides abscessus TaxID=36809 RepID=UPI00266D30F6|nr:phage tail tape measure protein [Mycobacteroides abscessus]MDO3245839.1 phage tail tape measure protein [Mycobacteroides abscessus subsp. abscessus]MDO3346783.1 phage tail tape measure protein [Mycobacteroides abscessus subsp. abscessus]
MPLTLDVLTALDESSLQREIERAQSQLASAGTDAGRDFSRNFNTAARGLDTHQAANSLTQEFDNAGRDAGARFTNQVEQQLKSSGGGMSQLMRDTGGEVADHFAGGFGGSASIARLGAAGGPIALGLAGVAALGVAAGKMLADGISEGMAQLQVQDVFQARMGVNTDTINRFGNAAGNAWAQGFGASAQENLSVLDVGFQARLLGAGTGEQEAQRFVERMQTVMELTGESERSLAQGARGLVTGGMVKDYIEAFDLIVAAQQKGLNLSGDMMNTLGEYAINFKNLGLTGAQALGLINQMYEGNIRNTDLAADALREFATSTRDGSVSTRATFRALGFDAAEMGQAFAAGGAEAQNAFGAIMVALAAVQDPQERNNIGLALFKERWNEANTAIAAMDFKTASQGFEDLGGKVDAAGERLHEHASGWTALGNTISNEIDKIERKIADSGFGRWFGQGLPGWIGDRFGDSDFDKQVTRGNENFDERLAQSPFRTGAQMPAVGTPEWNSLLDLASTGRIPGIAARDGKITDAAGNPVPEFNPAPAHNFYKDWYPEPTPAPPTVGPQIPFGEAKKQIEAEDKPAKPDKTPPSFDPSLWSVDANPVAMGAMPATPGGAPGTVASGQGFGPGFWKVDPQRVFDAESGVERAKNNLEQDRIRRLELEAKGNASQRELLSIKNQIQEDERAYMSAQMKLADAQQGTWKKQKDATDNLLSGLGQLGAALDNDLGASKGLAGMADNLVRFAASVAAAPMMGQLSVVAQANGGIARTGSGLAGFIGQQMGLGQSPAQQGYAAGYLGGSFGGGGMYAGDAALLANVPAGQYTQERRGDLTQGLADCSSAVEDLVNIMDGRPTAGASMYTGNAAEWLTQRGFLPGMGGDGDFRVGFNPSHMQATLPGGTNFNWGSNSAAAQRGMDGGQGAYDPAFTSHYYRPATGGGPTLGVSPTPISLPPSGYAPLGDAALANPGLTNPAPVGPGVPGALPGIGGAGGGGGYGPGGTGPMQGRSYGQGAAGGGGGFQGLGGAPMAALSTAAQGLDLLAPGAGQGAQIAMQLTNRAIGYAGQLAGIGVSGLMETFALNGSSLGDPSKSWIGKIAGGVAGARPALPNTAGQSAPPLAPPDKQKDQGQGQSGGAPMVNIEKFENGSGNPSDGQSAARDIARQFNSVGAGER